jgi:uncharacterized membrane protein
MKKAFRLLLSYLGKGILVVVPLVGALFVLVWAVTSLDSAINQTVQYWFNEDGEPEYIPGLGILTLLVGLIIVGMIFTNVVTEPISNWINNLLNRIPLFNTLYSSIKDFTEAFVGDSKKFNEPVLVLINETGLKKIGFLTQKNLTELGLQDEVIVYFPYAYSVAGQIAVVKASSVTPLNISSTDAMKLVVSGGVSGLEG